MASVDIWNLFVWACTRNRECPCSVAHSASSPLDPQGRAHRGGPHPERCVVDNRAGVDRTYEPTPSRVRRGIVVSRVERLITTSTEQVWAVLADGWLYPLWVVG